MIRNLTITALLFFALLIAGCGGTKPPEAEPTPPPAPPESAQQEAETMAKTAPEPEPEPEPKATPDQQFERTQMK